MTAGAPGEPLEPALAAALADDGQAGPDGLRPGVLRARAWLSRAAEPGTVGIWRYVLDAGPVAAALALCTGRAPAAVQQLVGVRAEQDSSLADLRAARHCGGRLVTPEHDEWPRIPLHALELAGHALPDEPRSRGPRESALVPPLALWVRGRRRLDEVVDRSVAVVGSRASTAYGEHVAAELAHGLAERGWTVLSGGAYGIDAAAHRGALAAGGATVAVLACGVDRPYPVGHGPLFAALPETGALISEWPPGSAPLRHRFLVRNRLIAALTRGTVVVEAAARSGAQATAARARGLGRPVMVVPGPVTSAMSVGCHALLREGQAAEDGAGARLVTGAAHVLEEVGRVGEDLAPPPERPATPRDGLSDVARRVLDACPVRSGVPPERLAAVAGCAVLDVLRALPALQVAGLVEQAAGGGWRVASPGPAGG